MNIFKSGLIVNQFGKGHLDNEYKQLRKWFPLSTATLLILLMSFL